MRFIFKSLLFLGLATYLTALSYESEGKGDTFMAQTSGAFSSLVTSFLKDNPPPKQKSANTLNEQDLAPVWHGPKKRG
jgi:hypothetical protein